jgi:hypothetical protein
MLSVAGNGNVRPRITKAWNRAIHYAAAIEINTTKTIEGVTSPVGIDAITRNEGNDCTRIRDQIPIGCATVSPYQVITALSSPGARPSPRTERQPKLITHASTTTRESLRPMATDNPKQELTFALTDAHISLSEPILQVRAVGRPRRPCV